MFYLFAGPKVITHLKVVQIRPDPPPISDCEVPVLLDSKESFHSDRWDLTTMQVTIPVKFDAKINRY